MNSARGRAELGGSCNGPLPRDMVPLSADYLLVYKGLDAFSPCGIKGRSCSFLIVTA